MLHTVPIVNLRTYPSFAQRTHVSTAIGMAVGSVHNHVEQGLEGGVRCDLDTAR